MNVMVVEKVKEEQEDLSDILSCEEVSSLCESVFYPSLATLMECLAWYESAWNSTAVEDTRYGLWLIDQSWCGQGPCPVSPEGLFNTTAAVECMAYAINDSGFTPWQDGINQCTAWIKAPATNPVPQC